MIPNTVSFWVFLALLIPSVLCSLFTLYFFLVDRTLRRAVKNHALTVVLIIGLVCSLTVYPWMMYYYRLVGIWQRAPAFCGIWKLIDWGLYTTHTIIFAWATVERHILIFHDRWVSTRKTRLFVHYLPLVVLLVYCLVFYVVVLFLLPCKNFYFNVVMICLLACYRQFYVIYIWETVVHQILPYVLILTCSVTLLVRVVWQRHRMNQPIEWRKYRKLTIQMLSISLLYLLFFFPLTLYETLSLFDVKFPFSTDLVIYGTFFSYLTILLFPFVCAMSLSELRKKIQRLTQLRRHARAMMLNSWATKVGVSTVRRVQ